MRNSSNARSLMVQGTMSGVGKSLIVAGLCRLLAREGYRVAPFKSQNMALNSAITADGLEIGRAQAMQAEAAGIEPTAAMNPVLLKPTTNTGSQVIVRGRPLATMAARDYFGHRRALRGPIMEAYRELAEDYDVVLIEGAGSPVELNLLADDIVNMGIAKMCAAPVILVGDIDRGGVFAQLIGTMMLLADDERRMVRASVVNKFRGDATLFDEGLKILAERMGVPCAGLVPYMPLDLDDEDSMSARLANKTQPTAGSVLHGTQPAVDCVSSLLDIAVIRLPKISNFTDFIALSSCEGVSVRYVSSPSELGFPDLLILPGTKATMADLAWMRATGLDSAVCAAARVGVPTLGICGGYQMLGMRIADPEGVEGGGEMRGLGLLPVATTFDAEKRTTRTVATFGEVGGPLSGLSGVRTHGYEIHMGQTMCAGGQPLLLLGGADSGRGDGCQAHNVYGCYLHGLFDDAAAAQALLSSLLAAKGLDPLAVRAHNMAAYRAAQYDALADGLRASLNMDLIMRIIEEGL